MCAVSQIPLCNRSKGSIITPLLRPVNILFLQLCQNAFLYLKLTMRKHLIQLNLVQKKIKCQINVQYIKHPVHVCCVFLYSHVWVVTLYGVYICSDQQRPWLLRQVEIDTHLLWRLNVLDYSLLLAHQPLHHDERHHSLSFANFIMRAKKLVSLTCFPDILLKIIFWHLAFYLIVEIEL